VLRATTGHAEVLGRDVGAMSEVELAEFRLFNMGFVFQGHNLLNSLTAHGNVRLPLMLRGMPMAQADVRAAEELEAVGLADKLDSLPRDLSGGQRQRVAIARATAGEPALLLADEPTASLDAASGQDVMGLLAGLARDRGTTVLVVTHDPRIFTYADRIVSIEDGQLFHEDSP
jgi:putative ABC transport system ATP-binding protein